MYCSSSLPSITAFNRRVAIVYDTTASGRFLLKWAADNILEPADNIFVVRAVPKVNSTPSSYHPSLLLLANQLLTLHLYGRPLVSFCTL